MTRETEPLKPLIRTAPSQGEGQRKDQTPSLGEPLAMGELQVYRAICLATPEGPISTEQLFKEVFHKADCTDEDRKYIWVIISRIKDKLGEEEIIGRWGIGYISRRSMIEHDFRSKQLENTSSVPTGNRTWI